VKTPPPLKWLAEKRARTLSELTKAGPVLDDLRRRVTEAQGDAAVQSERVTRLQLELDALDRTITVYDSLLDPDKIAAVNGWQGHYGKRGALGDRIVEIVGRHAPDWVQTDVIEALVVAELLLTFETLTLRRRWRQGSFKCRLKRLTDSGILERLQSPTVRQNAVGHWRLFQEKTWTLAELRKRPVIPS
jgi:hypothetical protein